MKKKCPICEERLKLIKELNKIAKKEGESEREKKRTTLLDKNKRFVQLGMVDELNECSDCRDKRRVKQNIVSSKSAAYNFRKHTHECSLCGARFPPVGSYDGDFVDDSLETIKKLDD